MILSQRRVRLISFRLNSTQQGRQTWLLLRGLYSMIKLARKFRFQQPRPRTYAKEHVLMTENRWGHFMVRILVLKATLSEHTVHSDCISSTIFKITYLACSWLRTLLENCVQPRCRSSTGDQWLSRAHSHAQVDRSVQSRIRTAKSTFFTDSTDYHCCSWTMNGPLCVAGVVELQRVEAGRVRLTQERFLEVIGICTSASLWEEQARESSTESWIAPLVRKKERIDAAWLSECRNSQSNWQKGSHSV